ncbi:MAG TPA: glycoside hydrolase family 13 protein [Kiritimatiellia bacterium]|nr:glycoside hydrolase family 13 protein [Kiritimatiellia bacterium]
MNAKDFTFVPAWARDAVWYQIFPERFRNGCPASNPVASDIMDKPFPEWSVARWGQDWYAREGWEASRNSFWDVVFYRRFGGDLVGVRDKLDYLQDLGINAIYLNPVFMSPTLHKYDASCFHHVDPTFGPDREGDMAMLAAANETEDPATWVWTAADRLLLDLIRDVHARGMRIILDGVFNHTGKRFFAFEDLKRNGKASRYRDWYKIKSWSKDGKQFVHEGWFGHESLPEFGRSETDLYPAVKDYIFNITRRWMDPDGDGDPSDGIDGWRLDVAFCVPHLFWKDWRKLVKSIRPDAYLTAEIVTLATEYVQGDEFDAVMNYMWLYPSVSFFTDGHGAITARQFREELDALRSAYPPEVSYVVQNLYDSHDVGRIASVMNNPAMLPVEDFERYFHLSRVRHGGEFVTTKPSPKAFELLRQMVIFQMTYIGAPMIYYGTEVGMWGANDPDDRQPMFWEDIVYDDETHTPTDRVPSSSRGPDVGLYHFYKQAIALRHNHPVLRHGGLEWVETGDSRVLAYLRKGEGRSVLVVLNASDTPHSFTVSGHGLDVWNGRQVEPGSVEVAGRGWLVVELERPG